MLKSSWYETQCWKPYDLLNLNKRCLYRICKYGRIHSGAPNMTNMGGCNHQRFLCLVPDLLTSASNQSPRQGLFIYIHTHILTCTPHLRNSSDVSRVREEKTRGPVLLLWKLQSSYHPVWSATSMSLLRYYHQSALRWVQAHSSSFLLSFYKSR